MDTANIRLRVPQCNAAVVLSSGGNLDRLVSVLKDSVMAWISMKVEALEADLFELSVQMK